MKILLVGTKSFHAEVQAGRQTDGQTGGQRRHEEANSRLSQFCEGASMKQVSTFTKLTVRQYKCFFLWRTEATTDDEVEMRGTI